MQRLNSETQRDSFIESANDIDDLFRAVYEKDMRILQRLLRLSDEKSSLEKSSNRWSRQGVFVKLEEDLDDSFDSDSFRSALKESKLKRALYVKRASIKKRFEIARMCNSQLRGLVEDRGYPLFPTGEGATDSLPPQNPPKKCTDVSKMSDHLDLVINFMDEELKEFLIDIIRGLELVREEINKSIELFYKRLDTGQLTLSENANKRQIYSKVESFEGDKISIELSISFFKECHQKICFDDSMKILAGRYKSFEQINSASVPVSGASSMQRQSNSNSSTGSKSKSKPNSKRPQRPITYVEDDSFYALSPSIEQEPSSRGDSIHIPVGHKRSNKTSRDLRSSDVLKDYDYDPSKLSSIEEAINNVKRASSNTSTRSGTNFDGIGGFEGFEGRIGGMRGTRRPPTMDYNNFMS